MSSASSVEVLACQVNVPAMHTAADRDRHLARISALVDAELQRQPAGLVVLPELCSIDYSAIAFSQLADLAEPRDGVSFARWRAVATANHCHVVYGFARQSDTGFRISLGVVAPDGVLVGCYDKIHLAQFGASSEKDHFEPGRRVFLFDCAGFRIATIVCADIRFPELCRALVVEHGADVIVHAGAYARDATFSSWHHFARTRALENQVYFLSVNRAGNLFGDSMLVPPWVEHDTQLVRFADTAEDMQRICITRSELDDARSSYPFLRDRISHYRS